MPSPSRRRGLWGVTGAVLVALLTSATSVASSPPSAKAAVARATTRLEVIAGERVTLTGTLPQAGERALLAQQKVGLEWLATAGANSQSSGEYSVRVAAPSTSTKVRVMAPRALVGGEVMASWASAVTELVPTPQQASIQGPGPVVAGTRLTLSTVFTPARPGRTVTLQRQTADGWTELTQAQQDATGRASFSVKPSTTTTYRAVAASWNGAPQVTTESPYEQVVTPSEEPGSDEPWVTGYYAGWFWDQMYPPEEVDMTAMTHFVFGRTAPGGGSLGGQPGEVVEGAGTAHQDGLAPDGQSVEEYLVDRAHAAGAKALLMLGGDGYDGAGFLRSTADPLRATFVDNVVDYVVEHGYDGIDVDWENCLSGDHGCGEGSSTPVSAQEARRRLMALINDLRVELESRAAFDGRDALITFPGYPVNTNFLQDGKVEPWQAEVAQAVDQYNLMSYGVGTTWSGGGWHSWFSGALKGASGHTPIDLESSIAAYEAAGVPRDRLGIGIGFYGIYYGPSITGPRQPTDGEPIYEVNDVALSYRELDRKGYLDHGQLSWDEAAQSTYRSYGGGGYVPANDPNANPAGMLSYEDPRSIAAKGDWVRETGVGGTILWTINYGYLPRTQDNPLLAAVKESFLN